MAAISMPKNISLLNALATLAPGITFREHDEFYWSPQHKTVYYRSPASDDDRRLLLHEVGHALLDHREYMNDLQLLDFERAAWQEARDLCDRQPLLDVEIPDDFIEDHLDTYREWLFVRSRCPTCNLNGIQSRQTEYSCLNCNTQWRVNEARTCRLKRQRLTSRTR